MANRVKRKIQVSIIIPSKNEELTIQQCLQSIYDQQTQYSFEIIVIDSGSSDNTCQLISDFPAVHCENIPPEEFGHGRTRNLGAAMARGQFLVFLNADALPVGKDWLDKLIDPLFENDSDLAGVYSRHIPYDDCHLYMVRDISRMMPEKGRITSYQDFHPETVLFSTVSAAIPKDIWRAEPFSDEIQIAEDQEWARRMLKKGFRIKYAAGSIVRHSHNFSTRQLFDSKRQLGIANPRFTNKYTAAVLGFFLMVAGIKIKVFHDFIYIFFKSHHGLSFSDRLTQMKISITSRLAGFRGRYQGWKDILR